jgi:two-component system OmpR family sensor kinase
VKLLRWVFALLPIAAGAVVAILVNGGWLGDVSLYMRADLAALALLAGGLVSGLAVLYLLRMVRLARNQRRALAQVQEDTIHERQRFLQRLDHELKNPLMALRAGLANRLDAASDPAERRELQTMQEQVLRARQLTADLRRLAQLETLALKHDPVDVAELLRQAVDLAREQPAAHERRLTLTLPQAPAWPLPTVYGDRELLLAAVFNLVDNAIKFTGPGDTVEVRASEDERVVQIEVADTGPGITPEDLPHLGKDLYRGQNAAEVPGSGVGLALAQAIVARHNGELAIRSRLEQGTLVTLRLPASRPERP